MGLKGRLPRRGLRGRRLWVPGDHASPGLWRDKVEKPRI